MTQEIIFKVAPSGLDYALKCKRCLWLSHKGIKLDAFFPPIFNLADVAISVGVCLIILFQRSVFQTEFFNFA